MLRRGFTLLHEFFVVFRDLDCHGLDTVPTREKSDSTTQVNHSASLRKSSIDPKEVQFHVPDRSQSSNDCLACRLSIA